LRTDVSSLDATRFSRWAVSTLYAIDPPFNLFPSLHLSIALLAASAAWKARRAYGAAALTSLAPVAASICTVKQHFVLDGIGGAALAAVVHAVVLRPYRPEPGSTPPRAGADPQAYGALLAAAYAGLYLGFRLTA
jgi:membrane-associated phospholipid phosphatase